MYDASWTLVVANAPYDALMGETTTWHGIERNAVWRHLVGTGSRAVSTPEEQARLDARLVADLRLTVSRYPADPSLARLVAELAALSPEFVALWESGEPGRTDETSGHKVIDHPAVGRLTLDTAEPGSEDAERLALAVVLGNQTFV